MSACDNDCLAPATFPQPIGNRPGLPAIAYRIGSYADLRAHMLLALDAAPALRQWTHRLPDDPGIALIEAAAEVGDILSFYQQLYANEAYLRTAQWRDSVAALVRLLGYRLAPGLGGNARFAFAVSGSRPVPLPAGLGIKAQLDGAAAPAVFETSAALLAQPALSQFHLYRPRVQPDLRHGSTAFTLAPGAAVVLKPGDRVMVGLPRSASDVDGDGDGDDGACDHAQILIVDQVAPSFGSTLVTMKGGLTTLAAPARRLATEHLLLKTGGGLPASLGEAAVLSAPRLRAWKLGATHRHFGHNAPPTRLTIDSHGLATQTATDYQRPLGSATGGDGRPALGARELPLDGEVKTLFAGTRVLVEGELSASLASGQVPRLLARGVAQVERRSLAWGDLGGASTVATLDAGLATTESGVTLDRADIRALSIHEVIGDGFELRAAFADGAETSGTLLLYYGSADQAAALAGRALLLADTDGTVTPATALRAEAAAVAPEQPAFHRVWLDRAVDYARFPYAAPPVTVYGNLAAATQGKTEAQITLGDGDGRARFQSFAIPKTPLTYLLDATQSPPQRAQLTVWVDGIAWTRVDSLYGCGPDERVYVVREDDGGRSWVQFGDGKTGARLKTGRGNVVAAYRSGNGAAGPLQAGARPALDRKLPGLDAAALLEPVTGGAAAESADGARRAAPGRMQSLGRIVSLADYEAEALALPGVIKARAAWATIDGVPLVRVTVLTASGAQADADAAADALRAAVRTRGAARCPLLVVRGTRSAVAMHLVVGYDAARRTADLQPAILAALGAPDTDAGTDAGGDADDGGDGLFGWRQRQFGESAHGSQVVGAVQNVPGVIWVRLTALAAAAPKLRLPAAGAHAPQPALLRAPTQRSLPCAGDSLLTLAAGDVQLQFTADAAGAAP